MSTLIETTPHEGLEIAWRQAAGDLAVSFLKRAIQPDTTLAELRAAVTFVSARADVSHLCLRDIFAPAAAPALPMESTVSEQQSVQEEDAAPRRRRVPQDKQGMRQLILAHLKKAQDGATTTTLTELCRRANHDVDGQRLGLLLNKLRDDGELSCDDGRPKTWRIRITGRTQAEPLMIRKARPQAEAEAVVVESPDTPAQKGLMTPDEVRAAAAALSQRFFAH